MASTIKSNTIDTVDNTALTIKQNNTTAMTINTSKQIGIGTTSPNKDGITKALTINSPVATNYSGLELSTADTLRTALISNSNGGFLYTATDIPLVFQTNNVERARFTSAGLHIGGTGSANALDDYEEGTFTVTNAGDSSGAFSAETGEYTKIGNIVFIRITFDVSTTFTSFGRIGGLPFTTNGDNSVSSFSPANVLTDSSTNNQIIPNFHIGQTYMTLKEDDTNQNQHFPNTTNNIYRISGFYFTDS